MNKVIYLLIFIISISLVNAVNIDTDKTDYAGGELVRIDISNCVDTSVVRVLNTEPSLADIFSSTGDYIFNYNTDSDVSDGKYSLRVSCDDGTTAEKEICVDSPGCVEVETPPSSSSSSSSGGSSSSSSSGGGVCRSEWRCSSWTECIDGTQSRTCRDLNRCRSDKLETQNCTVVCEESWVCSEYSECLNGTQTRTCVDEHNCETTLLQPNLEQTCEVELPPEIQQPEPSFWEKWGTLIIVLIVALVVIVTAIILMARHFKKESEY